MEINQSYIYDEIKTRLNMGNTCSHSLQNLWLPVSCPKKCKD